MIVLNGVLDTDTTISVIISNSVGAFSNSNPAFLPNAEAFLFENNSPVGQIFPDTDTALSSKCIWRWSSDYLSNVCL